MSPRIDPAAIVAVAMVLAVAVSGVAGAATGTEEQLHVGVSQSGADVTVTVTANGTAVENASVTVSTNASYAGNGTYATDENGTVDLPAPSENVTVTVTATEGNRTAATTVDLIGVDDTTLTVGVAQDGSDVTITVTDGDAAVENASVAVTALNNGSYADAGEYATGANGTVSLSAPEENVTVEVTADKGNATGSITADLVATEDDEPEFDSFGQRVSWFVHNLLGDGDSKGGIGQAVSEFVKSHNPSNDNKPDHAGKPADAGNTENGTSSGGPPEHAKKDKKNDKNDKKSD